MRSAIMALIIALALPGAFSTVFAAEKAGAQAGELHTVTLNIQKMDCPMCKITIRKALEKVPGVTAARVDYETKTATVTFDPKQATLEALTTETTNAGYPSTVMQK